MINLDIGKLINLIHKYLKNKKSHNNSFCICSCKLKHNCSYTLIYNFNFIEIYTSCKTKNKNLIVLNINGIYIKSTNIIDYKIPLIENFSQEFAEKLVKLALTDYTKFGQTYDKLLLLS